MQVCASSLSCKPSLRSGKRGAECRTPIPCYPSLSSPIPHISPMTEKLIKISTFHVFIVKNFKTIAPVSVHPHMPKAISLSRLFFHPRLLSGQTGFDGLKTCRCSTLGIFKYKVSCEQAASSKHLQSRVAFKRSSVKE